MRMSALMVEGWRGPGQPWAAGKPPDKPGVSAARITRGKKYRVTFYDEETRTATLMTGKEGSPGEETVKAKNPPNHNCAEQSYFILFPVVEDDSDSSGDSDLDLEDVQESLWRQRGGAFAGAYSGGDEDLDI
jgi:hypothetical protein